ncbi:zinc-dependent metalloprotease family protein [Flavobacterium cheonanense]|uniref:Zinc-dependent metalloprotease family protein n=1 Tax=Flavobacterium cheonanense TaxID=706183 RepID=A0ABP7VG89_9FLAO
MKLKLLSVALLAMTSFAFAQQKGSFWKTSTNKNVPLLESRMQLPEKNLLDLDVDAMKATLSSSPKRDLSLKSAVIVSLPNTDGEMEQFRIYENSNMDPALAARYPEIKSYIGIGINNPTSKAYFSMSPLGFKSMVIGPDQSAVFIEPFSQDLKTYSVYKKADKAKSFSPFECSVVEEVSSSIEDLALRPNADDSTLRTFRLAVSTTGEYTAYFGGTKALALAAINNTMTRVNGVFENDFAVRMILIANNDAVIYTDAASDPYTTSYNSQLQTTLTNVIGSANYDVGHLFVRAGNNGNAGCIGCVCNAAKGSGFTSSTIPTGDTFDIDYVAHEIGHQFGANHTFSMNNEGTGVNMEPGSGSTIMGYAGITSQDVQTNSDAYFHAASIQQVTNNVKTKTCQTNTATGNSVPTALAGLDYTIPKSTPFMLTGSGTDANGDVLTYNWEQFDNAASTATGASSAASATRTSGPTFRSYNSSTSPVRYFPNMTRVLAGATTTAGTEITVEALPSVARTMNFRLTVRDNRAGGSANNSDDMIVTVNGTAGPFSVSSPNTAVSYVGGSSQTVTWAVAGTTANGVNCANVDILLSTDGGASWSTLLAATPNDGTQAVTIPNTPGTTNRIMVKGTNHIFFDVSNTNFTITSGVTDTVAPTAPILAASVTTQTSTNLSWSGATDNVAVTGYDVYRGATLIGTTASTTFAVTGLTASNTYSFTVRAKDAAGNVSADSNSVSVTTLVPVVDTTAPTAPTLSASGTTQTTTNLSWTGATDNVGVTGYDVLRNGVVIGSTSTATTFAVTGLTASTSYAFNVRAKDAAGNISVNSNTVSVTTLAVATVTYCTASANSTADERIGRVQLGTINNPSTGTAGYENFTAISTNLVRGTSNTITITPTWTGTVYSEGYRVYIDYNRDGDFTDAGESVFSRARTTATPVSGSFTVPTTAALGATRMRVIMRYNATPTTPCGTFDFGQVEDYTVNITATARVEEASNNQISFNLYPNPVSGDVLNISNLEADSSYRIYNMMGQELGKGKIENESINVGNLAAGTYLIEVSNANGATSKRFIKQ